MSESEYVVVGRMDPAIVQAAEFSGEQIIVDDGEREEYLVAVPKEADA